MNWKGLSAEDAETTGEMLVIRGSDFASVRYGDTLGVPRRFIPQLIAAKKQLQPKDVLIETASGTKEQPTERTVFLKEKLFKTSKHTITCASFSRFLRVNTTLAVPEYIFWDLQFLCQSGAIEQHQVQHTGIAQFQYPKFAQSAEIPLPPLPGQQAITRILSSRRQKRTKPANEADTGGDRTSNLQVLVCEL